MAKPESWRTDPASYPYTALISTRFADMDVLGHINNVAIAGMFEEGRVRFNHALKLVRHGADTRWLIAGVDIAYLGEAHYPRDVTVVSGVGRLGRSSWTVLSAAFQADRCVATCDTTIVYTDKNGARPFPDDFRRTFEGVMAGKAA